MRTDETWFEYARRRHENGKLRKALAEVHSQVCPDHPLRLGVKFGRLAASWCTHPAPTMLRYIVNHVKPV